MRGAVSAISLILITGIVLALIGVAYTWGVPMIEKGTILNQYRAAESFIKDLDRGIVEIANSGSGSRSLDIPVGALRVVPFGEENSLVLDFQVNQPMVFNSSFVPIDTPSLGEPGVFGTDSPRTIILSSDQSGSVHALNLNLHYRVLESGSRGYVIALQGDPSDRGTSRVDISFIRTETIEEGCCGGQGDLVATYVRLDLI